MPLKKNNLKTKEDMESLEVTMVPKSAKKKIKLL